MKLLVIGGTGFFGKAILDFHKRFNLKKYGISELIITARNTKIFLKKFPELNLEDVKYFDIDILNAKKLPDSDLIIFSATTSTKKNIKEAKENYDKTILGVKNLISILCKKNKIKLIFCSSGAVYGSNNGEVPFEENYKSMNYEAFDISRKLYAKSKIKSEDLLAKFSKESNNTIISARCFSFFGKYLPIDKHFVIGQMINSILAGKELKINSGRMIYRSFMSSDNLVQSLIDLFSVNNNRFNVFNVGSENAYEILEILEKFNLKFDLKFHVGKRNSSNIDYYIPNIDKLKKIIKFEVSTLDEIISQIDLKFYDEKYLC